MFTRNFFMLLPATYNYGRKIVNDLGNTVTASINAGNLNSAEGMLNIVNIRNNSKDASAWGTSAIIFGVGSGNSTPSLDDYELEHPILESYLGGSVGYNLTREDRHPLLIFNLSNNSNDSSNIVNITELGIYWPLRNNGSRYALIFRETFPSVTIEPGESKQIKILLVPEV